MISSTSDLISMWINKCNSLIALSFVYVCVWPGGGGCNKSPSLPVIPVDERTQRSADSSSRRTGIR